MPAAPVPVNATAAAVLGLLHGGPMTGSELVASARGRFGTFFSVTRSQVYRELPVLADAGLLVPGEVGPRASQRYRITAAGKRAFRAWLAGPGGIDALRSPLVLRLLHADRLADEERAALVEASRAAYAEQLNEASTAAESEKDPYARAVAEFVVAHLRAMLALLDRVPA
jgi:DNA-binding PadR family transcriptional regulator